MALAFIALAGSDVAPAEIFWARKLFANVSPNLFCGWLCLAAWKSQFLPKLKFLRPLLTQTHGIPLKALASLVFKGRRHHFLRMLVYFFNLSRLAPFNGGKEKKRKSKQVEVSRSKTKLIVTRTANKFIFHEWKLMVSVSNVCERNEISNCFHPKHAINSSLRLSTSKSNVEKRLFLLGYWLMKPFRAISLSNFIHIRYALRPSTHDEWILQITRAEKKISNPEKWEQALILHRKNLIHPFTARSFSDIGWTFNNEGLRIVSGLVGNLFEIVGRRIVAMARRLSIKAARFGYPFDDDLVSLPKDKLCF